MKNIFLITKREYLTQVKKKSFIILTILAPIIMIAFGAFIAVMLKANETQYTVNVIDKGGLFAGKLKSDNKLKYVYVNPASESQLVHGLKDMEETNGLLILAPLEESRFDLLEKNSKLLVNDKIGFETKQRIVDDLSAVLREVKIKQLNIDRSEERRVGKEGIHVWWR